MAKNVVFSKAKLNDRYFPASLQSVKQIFFKAKCLFQVYKTEKNNLWKKLEKLNSAI